MTPTDPLPAFLEYVLDHLQYPAALADEVDRIKAALAKAKRPTVTPEEIAAMWHQMCPPHPKVASPLAKGVKEMIQTALNREGPKRDWPALFRWLRGDDNYNGQRGYIATLEYAMRKATSAKYDCAGVNTRVVEEKAAIRREEQAMESKPSESSVPADLVPALRASFQAALRRGK